MVQRVPYLRLALTLRSALRHLTRLAREKELKWTTPVVPFILGRNEVTSISPSFQAS